MLLARSRGATSWIPTYVSERPLDRVASSDVTQVMLVALKGLLEHLLYEGGHVVHRDVDRVQLVVQVVG